DPLFKCGQSIARLYHPYINLVRLFSNEVKVQQRVLDPGGTTWHELPITDRREHELYLFAKEMILSFKNDLPKDAATFRPNILELVSMGQSSAIKNDLHKLKLLIPLWVAACSGSPQTDCTKIWQQGFKDEVVGSLLCPVSLNWLDPSVKVALRASRQELSLSRLPRILYQDMDYEDKDPWQGFLQNGVLVKVFPLPALRVKHFPELNIPLGV
ncbi:hypothetical protein BKA70DRAFT_1134924, partial [Coprinopsis sp. MPI-PUGE-AT-0042]